MTAITGIDGARKAAAEHLKSQHGITQVEFYGHWFESDTSYYLDPPVDGPTACMLIVNKESGQVTTVVYAKDNDLDMHLDTTTLHDADGENVTVRV